jgi:hypothetical protein
VPEKTATEEVAQGVRSVFDRIGEFFHLFDLSFFVSGFVLLGAFAFLYIKLQLPRTLPIDGWLKVVGVIIAIYVNGLVAFAAGRLLNGKMFRSPALEEDFMDAINIHDLNSGRISDYIENFKDNELRKRTWRLYIRMWAEIAHREPTSIAYRHLTRYWVMAATYDGVGFALWVWAIVLFLTQFSIFTTPLPQWLANIGAFVLAVAGLLSFIRGAAYYKYQVEDVVAELATIKSKLL